MILFGEIWIGSPVTLDVLVFLIDLVVFSSKIELGKRWKKSE